jgi:2,4-dienoyl-CoA reductase-like NADH-dependent reductase (Old Yellow Enzyme family)/thioredoxin reductase
MAFEYLLREGRINSMIVRNRLIAGPMERSMAHRDGSLTADYIAYLTERARGGAGLIYVESTYVDVRGMGHLFQVGCHGNHVIPALKRLAKAVHAEGAMVALELYMGGRQTPAYMAQRQPIAPSAVVCKNLNPAPIPREMTDDDIREVIGKFADAARRVVEAGLDMVVLHGAHGYLLDAFLSPYSNLRADQYGGSLENRARFPIEVLQAVRKVTGPSFPISYRLSADEYIDGGLTVRDTALFSQMLSAAGIDMIDVSGGIYESFPMIIQGPEAPKGGFVRNARAIKDAVGEKIAVSVAQRLNDPVFADQVLRNEGLDFISLTRAFHADPHFAAKVRESRADDIIPCIACHHCTNLLEANQPVRCAVNPQTGLERQRAIHPVSRPRRVMIVGGGPAGMQAARILALQGNEAILFERGEELGGQMRYSSRVAADYGYLVTYLAGQMRKLRVDVRLNTTGDLQTIDQVAPDALVIATGANGGLRFCPWRGEARTFDLFTALDRPEDDWEERVVVIGGDSESCFLALYLAGHGAEVHVVEPKNVFSDDKMSPGRDLLMMALESLETVKLRSESTVEEVWEDYVLIQRHGEFEQLTGVGSVVVGGRTANNALYEEVLDQRPGLEVYNIGDSVVPRDVYYASHEAAEAAGLIGLRASGGKHRTGKQMSAP